MIFAYIEDGGRTPFDPLTMGAHLKGCILCGRRVNAVGLFLPLTDDMRAVVMRLRRHPQRAQSTACIAYALCARCVDLADVTTRVEAALVAAAERVTVQ
jgi:hypothetical protein